MSDVDRSAWAEPVASVPDWLFIACGLSWAAGLIHVAAAFGHLSQSRLYAVCFAVLAPVQLAWGFLTCRRSSKRLLLFGVVLSIAVVIAWALSRTTGLPVGPQPWHAEEVGVIDSIATADELLLALVVSVYGLSPPRRPVGVALGRLALGCAVVLVTVSSLALLGAAHVS